VATHKDDSEVIREFIRISEAAQWAPRKDDNGRFAGNERVDGDGDATQHTQE